LDDTTLHVTSNDFSPREMLPAGVQAVLAARIDGLEPHSKTVLRDASIVGGRFVGQSACRGELPSETRHRHKRPCEPQGREPA